MQAVVDIIAAVVLALAAAAFSHFGVSFERSESRPAVERPRDVERTDRRAPATDAALGDATVVPAAVRSDADCPEAALRA